MEGLLDEFDAEAHKLRHERDGLLGFPARVRIHPDRAGEDRADRLKGLEVLRPPELDLESREMGRPRSTLAHDGRLVDADREIGRRQVRGESAKLVDGLPCHLADQIVERDVERATRGPVTADRTLHGVVRRDQPDLACVDLPERLEQERKDGRHGLRGLTVKPVRIALADADDPRETVVHQFDDDRRHAVTSVVVGSCDLERVPERQPEDLLGHMQGHAPATHGSASTRSRMTDHRRSAPKRTGSSAGRPVSIATASMIRRASSSSG